MPALLSILFLHVALALGPADLMNPAAASASAAAATPATQPSVVVVQTGGPGSQSLVDSWSNTRLAQIIEGKQTLTWKDVTKPYFWIDTLKDLIETLVTFIPRFIGTLIFLFVFWLIYRGVRRVAVGNMKKSEVDSSIRDMLATLIKWFVMGFGLVIACNQLGIPIVAMLTGVSIIGLAVGFAAQETLANFIAGIVIFLDKPFKVNEWIEIDGTFGRVKRISFRATRLLDLDGDMVVLPNTHMLSSKVLNKSTHPLNRVSVAIGISYRASIDDARKALLDTLSQDSRILREPKAEVIVANLGESSVDLKLRFWIEDEALEHRIGYEYLEKAKKALDAAGVEIPFPHLQLLLEETPAIAKLANRPAA